MDADAAPQWLRDILHTLAQSAAAALEEAGAEVVFVDAGRPASEPGELVSGAAFDGVLVLGGADIEIGRAHV